jgi:pyridoxal phosphate enzyme (YggS family)
VAVAFASEMAVVEEIAANVTRVRERMAAAARRAGRTEKILLVAVSKGQPVDRIRAGYDAGLRDFGENRVEEAVPKIDALTDLADLHWHMIGHIQSRKADRASGRFDLIHSVDRFKIARLLDARAAEQNERQPILLECNVSGEASKAGWPMSRREDWEGQMKDIEAVLGLEHLEVRGLMTMAPMSDDHDLVRSVFRRLRALRDHLARRFPGNWDDLSMGMTDDYELAVEEGATIVRIGRAIFGERPDDP